METARKLKKRRAERFGINQPYVLTLSRNSKASLNLERENDMTETISKVLATPCEKADVCKYATRKCREAIPYLPDEMLCLPARRWTLCCGWSLNLGMVFDEKSGNYVYLSGVTRRKLDGLKREGETYDMVVKRLIEEMVR